MLTLLLQSTATSHSQTFLDVLALLFLLNQVIWQVSGGYCGESLTQVIKHKPFFFLILKQTKLTFFTLVLKPEA